MYCLCLIYWTEFVNENQRGLYDHIKIAIILVMIRLEGRSKREARHSKILLKELDDLKRGQQAMDRFCKDRNQNDEDPDDQYIDRKGKQWWEKFDDRNFPSLSLDKCKNLREITTSDHLLQIQPKETLHPTSFHKYKILSEYDLLAEEDLLHVLFKSNEPRFRCLTSYELESAMPAEASPLEGPPEAYNFKLTPCNDTKEVTLELKEYKLALAGYNEDEQACRTVAHYKRALKKLKEKNPVEKELYFWKKELEEVNEANRKAWKKIIPVVENQLRTPSFYGEDEIVRIRDYLMWATMLKYFQHGYADKTTEMLQQLIDSERNMKPIKSKDASSKKFFETDCKICFCSFNYDSNQVLYCDSCNTSFHLACYGLQEVPREEIYYCDCCRFQKKENAKAISCQLCGKAKFPIKKLDGHFYHVTCLMLFNLVYIDKGTLVLRTNFNHLKIMQMVVESELSLHDCLFCSNSPGAQVGARMRCGFAGCSASAHPICAYINGCKFWIKRDRRNQKLESSFYCNNHDSSRDWIRQTYLRRYMCNFRNTSEVKDEAFRTLYAEQLEKLKQFQENLPKGWDTSKITVKTRYVKKKLAQDEQKNAQSSEVMTETRKYLDRLKKKNN